MSQLIKNVQVSAVQAPLASGGTDPASTYVDMQAFEGVMFVGYLGTAGSTDVCTFRLWGSTSTSSTGAVMGAAVSSSAGEDDKLFLIDEYKPTKRYVKCHLTRSAAVEYGGTIAIQYEAHSKPTAQTAAMFAATAAARVSTT